MTDAAAPTAASRSGPAPWLFALAVFVSASLIFVVQPMLARMILPRLGGSSMVWNTCLVFFQAALLAGYFYADLLQRIGSLHRQMIVHLVVLGIGALALPLRISGLLGDPWVSAPALWLVASLTLSIGAPFAALSATAPLIQAWCGRLHHAQGRNPYVLYAASNLGSLLALLAYPLVVEPFARLGSQSAGWSAGYGGFAAIVLIMVLLAWRQRADGALRPAEAPPTTWRQRLTWMALAAAPSSLLLGVTGHISADIASAPFLWVVPLALYLVTFIIAFEGRSNTLFEDLTPFMRTILVPEALLLFAIPGVHPLIQLPIHLLAFFFTAQVCAYALARRRPPPARLTEFFLWLSVGGVIGGSFNALIAPLIFNGVWEYPIVLVLACLATPGERRRLTLYERGWVGISLICAIVLLLPLPVSREVKAALLLTPAVCAFLLRNQTKALVLVLSALAVGAYVPQMLRNDIRAYRSFFGVVQIKTTAEKGVGAVRVMVHGSTLHGAQRLDPNLRCIPTTYYTPNTPIGQAFAIEQARHPGLSMATVGLGTGTVAAFVRPTDRLTFFEIDPLIANLASDPKQFSYVNGCARGPVGVTLGDARLRLDQTPAGAFDLLLVDAFSSDSVPTHLMTVQSMRTYLRVLKPGGVVVVHLSNRNLALLPPAAAAVRAAGGVPLEQLFMAPGNDTYKESSSHVMIFAHDRASLAPYLASGKWEDPTRKGRAWTDDYTNIVGAMIARYRGGVDG
jgi:SAM-dependent methyltransferase